MNEKKEFCFISDPGHGWLEVPVKEVRKYKIKISSFSYMDSGMAYLEEDCDAPTFLKAWQVNNPGREFYFTERHEDFTPIREYVSYK